MKTYLPDAAFIDGQLGICAPTEVAISRTGLVVEYGNLHFDWHNRLRKERPERIKSIIQAIKRNKMYERCHVLDSTDSDADEVPRVKDFAKVHLPSYLHW